MLAETILDRVTPYAKHSYEEQLRLKHADLSKMLSHFNKTLDDEIRRKAEVAPAWYAADKQMPLDPEIIHSETIDAYRNKVEFTVGRRYAPPAASASGQLWDPKAPICVGFNRGHLAKGILFVEELSPRTGNIGMDENLIYLTETGERYHPRWALEAGVERLDIIERED